jgi:hypothetical protein
MAKANPKAYFPSYTTRIYYRKVDRFAAGQAKWKPFFPTWTEAHQHMLMRSADRLKKAKAELKSATAFDEKVRAMKKPEESKS